MSWGFAEIGMTRAEIERGIDEMENRQFNIQEWSGKVYLIDPRNGRLWDLKIALRMAAEKAALELYPGFTSDRYRQDLLKAGVSYVRFSHDAKRKLGVCGNDLSELLDAHELYLPDGNVVPMGASPLHFTSNQEKAPDDIENETMLAYEYRVKKWHLRYERYVCNGRYIKRKLGLMCQGCGLDAETAFGRDLAMSCIEAHHLKPVAEMPPEGRSVNIKDFAVLCATCHRLIHRLTAPDDLEGLRRLVTGAFTHPANRS